MLIKLTYRSSDGSQQTKIFRKLESARKWAHEMVGRFPEFGRGYAVSGDGVGTIRVAGGDATLEHIFPPAIARHWCFDANGGFLVVSKAGHFNYAYPTSPHAEGAKSWWRMPLIAEEMAASADEHAQSDPVGAARRDEYLNENMIAADRVWRQMQVCA